MRTLTVLILLLATALPCLAATTWPAGTNTANQTFFGNNNFRGSLQQGGVDVLTNIPSTISVVQLNAGTVVFSNAPPLNLSASTNYQGAVNSPTNTWSNGVLPVGTGTNYFISSGTATFGITGIANSPTSTEHYGQLLIAATGTVTFTNLAALHMSDGLTSRTVTNGTACAVAVDVMPGQPHGTNGAIVMFP
jgi:hypothetical protein